MGNQWWKEAVFYQIYPRSFQDSNGDGIGDLQGIINRLDYLHSLGVDCLWICPFFQSPNTDNGYDISNYKEIAKEYGTMDDFDRLLKEVHKRGMKLIIDLVVNHTSDEHPWFIESRSSKDSEKRDWYIWRDGRKGKEPNNWESIFGGSAWEFDKKTGQYYLHLFSKKQPDLNWENGEVRNAIYEMMNWWLDKKVDGFRIDAITHIKKRPGLPSVPNQKGEKYVPSFSMHTNQKGIHHFLKEMKEKTYKDHDVVVIGEANGVKAEEAVEWVGEKEGTFHMIFQFEHLGLWDGVENVDVDIVKLKKVLTKWQKALTRDGWNALFVENHDKPRIVSTLGSETYLYESATAIGVMYFFMKGTPFIYQGQEIGMTNVQYPSIDCYDDIFSHNLYKKKREEGLTNEEALTMVWRTSRDNSRTPMQWSAEKNAGFTTGTPWLRVNPNYKKINVEEQRKKEQSVLSFYKKMIQLRKSHRVFCYGSYELLHEDDSYLFAYVRTLNEENVVVIVNLSEKEVHFTEKTFTFSYDKLLLHNLRVKKHAPTSSFILRPFEVRIYEGRKRNDENS